MISSTATNVRVSATSEPFSLVLCLLSLCVMLAVYDVHLMLVALS
jgi:hypothetical protein